MMKISDRIIAPSRGSAAEAIDYATRAGAYRLPDVIAYINEVYRLAPVLGIDAAIPVAQSCHETAAWTSQWWLQRLNPAGIGITGDPKQNLESRTWTSGVASARSHLAHLLLYATGKIEGGGLTTDDDPRYGAYRAAYGETIQAQTIADLTNKWATDDLYDQGIVRRGNEVYPGLPDQTAVTIPEEGPMAVTFGKVPHPPFENRDIPSSVNTAWDDLGPRTIRGIVWHRSIGSHSGNDNYFRGEGRKRALTDYGIGVLAQDGAALAGSIYRWNNPRGQRSPWANGKLSQPYGDGLAFYTRYGINAIGRDLTSVEISGFQETPLDEKSRAAIAGLTAYWADQYKVSWETFPMVADEGRSFVIWHEEFTIGTGKRCPFKVVKDETPTLIERTRAILKKHQSGDAVPEQPTQAVPHPITGTGTHIDANKNVWVDSRRAVTPVQPVQTYEWADKTSGKGPQLKAAKAVTVYFVTSVLRENAIETWGTTKLGWRFLLSDALAA